ncbi:MAG TPA: hypothetical protein DIT97_15425 [Gimesia maris]|uniref:Uncharacterized protein n=1 Tax=Gimesia maris TaxID=122 RepID=A0A3D3R8D8_9PLAN|nr:hypothetical protein [Gimesia maris]|tara:strand:+ start:8646 stop:9833 length:1188 start_codon:yes stop_codon:yes gene_type:complete
MQEPQNSELPSGQNGSSLNRWIGYPWGSLILICFALMLLVGELAEISDLALGTHIIPLSESADKLFIMAMFLCFFMCAIRRMAQLGGREIPLTDNKRCLWTAGIMMLAFLGCNMVSLIIPAAHAASVAANKAQNRQAPWASHTFGDGRFLIQTPAGWQLTEIPTIGPGNIYVADSLNDLHLIAFSAPKIDTNLSSLKEVIQLSVKNQSARFEQVQEVESALFLTGVFPAADSTLKILADRTHLIYQIRVLDCGDSWVELHLWATPSQYVKNEKLLKQIRDSLQLANSDTPQSSKKQTSQPGQLPAGSSYWSMVYRGFILMAMVLVMLVGVISAVQGLRKSLATESNPTWKTYANELGGYAVILILIGMIGIAMLLDESIPGEPEQPLAPALRNST